MVTGIQAHQPVFQPPLLQSQDTRSLGELIINFEMQEIARRIAIAVESFFAMLARFLVESYLQLKNWTMNILPNSSDQSGISGDLATELRTIMKNLRVPTEQREDVLVRVQPLIDQRMTAWGKREVVEAVAAVPEQERATFVDHARPLIAGMNWWSIKCILRAIVATPAPERGAVIAHALPLFADRMDGEEKEALIGAIRAVRAEDRADVIAHAGPLITEGRGNEVSSHIIQAVAAILPEQRADVIRHARELITPEMPGDRRARIIEDLAAVPENGRAAAVEDWRAGRRGGRIANVNFAMGLNVHDGNRDPLTLQAIALLCRNQGPIDQNRIDQAHDAFVAYLDASPAFTAQRKQAARESLLGGGGAGWGALVREQFFLPQNNARITGKELIGRLWTYVCQINDPRDSTNAKDGMIAALEDGRNVCGMGKAQRLIVATLQGRLDGVDIEGDVVPRQVTRQNAMNMFFLVPERQQIDTLNRLLEAANQFCNQNPGVNRAHFLEDIHEYARNGAIV